MNQDLQRPLDGHAGRLHHFGVRALMELDVLVIDCQATGASPLFGHVLELGWGVVRGGTPNLVGAEAHWIQLPDGHRVPRQVRKLTGYDPAHAAGALPDHDAWQRLRDAVPDAFPVPTAIHYARFELAFLNEWATRFEPDAPFRFETVCTHAIAKRLYPELPRQTLRALAGFLGHGLELERRARGHVEATAFVWRSLCKELEQRGVTNWSALGDWLAERPPSRARSSGKPKYPIDPQRYRFLPDAPGVYRLLRCNGDVLYVGKATSLKKRVASHFTGRASKAMAPEMLTQVSDIDVSVAPSALEAALLENETIKSERPPYNVQLMANDQPVWYSTPDFDAAAPAPDARYRIGPLGSEWSLSALGALSVLLTGAPADSRLRSRAVGLSALSPPDADVFRAGWDALLWRHSELTESLAGARQRSLVFARKLLELSAPATEEQNPTSAPGDRHWDPARVVRHIESAALQAYRAYRRAHWLGMLLDCEVTYREPGAMGARLLTVQDGAIVSGAEPQPCKRGARTRRTRGSFDRVRFDRLRVLTSELKRIVRDGGEVTVQLGAHGLKGQLLLGVLRVV